MCDCIFSARDRRQGNSLLFSEPLVFASSSTSTIWSDKTFRSDAKIAIGQTCTGSTSFLFSKGQWMHWRIKDGPNYRYTTRISTILNHARAWSSLKRSGRWGLVQVLLISVQFWLEKLWEVSHVSPSLLGGTNCWRGTCQGFCPTTHAVRCVAIVDSHRNEGLISWYMNERQ